MIEKEQDNKILDKPKRIRKIRINKNSSIYKAIRFFLSIAIIIGIGYAILNYVPFIAKYNQYVIVTDSMKPVINVGDVVIVDTSIKPEDLKIGQIIAFYTDFNNDGKNEVVVHYLSSIHNDAGIITYRTTPEVSDQEDRWILHDSDVIGEKVLTIRKIGSFMRFATSTLGKIVIVTDIIVIYLLFEILSEPKFKHKENKEIKKEES